VQVDEGVDMEIMIAHLVQPSLAMVGPPQTQQQPNTNDMTMNHEIQEVFDIVDELAGIPECMHGTFVGHLDDEPPMNAMEMPSENDEDSRANLARL
jgi:hypothetical protein